MIGLSAKLRIDTFAASVSAGVNGSGRSLCRRGLVTVLTTE